MKKSDRPRSSCCSGNILCCNTKHGWKTFNIDWRSQALDVSFVDCLANSKNRLQFYPLEIQLKRELKLSVSHSTVFCYNFILNYHVKSLDGIVNKGERRKTSFLKHLNYYLLFYVLLFSVGEVFRQNFQSMSVDKIIASGDVPTLIFIQIIPFARRFAKLIGIF